MRSMQRYKATLSSWLAQSHAWCSAILQGFLCRTASTNLLVNEANAKDSSNLYNFEVLAVLLAKFRAT